MSIDWRPDWAKEPFGEDEASEFVKKQVEDDTCEEHGEFCCFECFNMEPAGEPMWHQIPIEGKEKACTWDVKVLDSGSKTGTSFIRVQAVSGQWAMTVAEAEWGVDALDAELVKVKP
jgi:hypothetical protein